ncbi:MAG: Gfo/Idh/MocA family oxidoreductase [Planctomycetaceae bacterium]
MAESSRRTFLKQTGLGVASAVALNLPTASARAAGANDRVVVALIGCGGRGRSLIDGFENDEAGEVAYFCDPDKNHANQAASETKTNRLPTIVTDLRRVLDDKTVDAVVIATPDHWHAPAAILACDAGKHVYVEKPCSHNLREGRLLVEAARRNNRVVQHGTQSRSMQLIADGVQMLREGIIGDVLVAKAWNVQRRNDIGHAQPSDPPAGLDYDQWVGPAAFLPYQSNRLHYNWHWWHNFGTGDMGNDGAHELDYARWGLGVETHPTLISGLGGTYFFNDDQQFPDTQQVAFEYPGDGKQGSKRMLIWEMRIWSSNYPHNVDNGTEFFGTKGRMLLTKRGKLEVFGEGTKRVEAKLNGKPANLLSHIRDFFDAIRTGRKPNADIEIGHTSASLCHLGNIATRVGRTLQFDPKHEAIIGDDEASHLLTREYRDGHWAIPAGA